MLPCKEFELLIKLYLIADSHKSGIYPFRKQKSIIKREIIKNLNGDWETSEKFFNKMLELDIITIDGKTEINTQERITYSINNEKLEELIRENQLSKSAISCFCKMQIVFRNKS